MFDLDFSLVATYHLCVADDLKLVQGGLFLKVKCTKRSVCFETEHRHGATLSELESEAEPLYEQVARVGNSKPHSLKERRSSHRYGWYREMSDFPK